MAIASKLWKVINSYAKAIASQPRKSKNNSHARSYIYREPRKPIVSTRVFDSHEKPMGWGNVMVVRLSCMIPVTNISRKEYQALIIFVKLFIQTYNTVYNEWGGCVTLFRGYRGLLLWTPWIRKSYTFLIAWTQYANQNSALQQYAAVPTYTVANRVDNWGLIGWGSTTNKQPTYTRKCAAPVGRHKGDISRLGFELLNAFSFVFLRRFRFSVHGRVGWVSQIPLEPA